MLTYQDHMMQWGADRREAEILFPDVVQWECISSSRRADGSGRSSSVWKGYLDSDKVMRAYVFIENGKVYKTEVSR